MVFDQNFTPGETLTISDSQDTILTTYTITKAANSLVYSSPQLRLGQTYTVTVGSQTQTFTQDSMSTGADSIRGNFGRNQPRNFESDNTMFTGNPNQNNPRLTPNQPNN